MGFLWWGQTWYLHDNIVRLLSQVDGTIAHRATVLRGSAALYKQPPIEQQAQKKVVLVDWHNSIVAALPLKHLAQIHGKKHDVRVACEQEALLGETLCQYGSVGDRQRRVRTEEGR